MRQLEYGVGNHGAQVLVPGGGVPPQESRPGQDDQLLRHRRIPRLAALSPGADLHRRTDLQPRRCSRITRRSWAACPDGNGSSTSTGSRTIVLKSMDSSGDDPPHRPDSRQRPELGARVLRRPLRRLRPRTRRNCREYIRAPRDPQGDPPGAHHPGGVPLHVPRGLPGRQTYNTMANMYLVLGDRATTPSKASGRAFEEVDDPYLREPPDAAGAGQGAPAR